MKIDLARLKATSPRLHKALEWYVKPDGDVHDNIPIDLKDRLDDWVTAHSEPELVDTHHEDMRKLADAENARVRGERAGAARLQYWLTQGLLDNQHNADAITNFIESSEKLKSLRGKVSAQTVDIAVDYLGPRGTNVLQWKPKPVPVAPPPPSKPPKPWQPGDALPEAATEEMLRKSSLKEVIAWRDRQRSKNF